MDKETARIVIIGAGMAGLSAASYLVQEGFKNVLVLEATNRTGGRIYTESFGKSVEDKVQLGANWIHGGALNNPIVTLANQLGLLKEWPLLDRSLGFIYTADGRAINRDLFVDSWKVFQKWEEESSNYNINTIRWDQIRMNFQEYLQTRLDSYLPNCPKDNQDLVKIIFNCFLNYSRFHQGTPLKDIPVPDPAGFDCDIPGGNIKVGSGVSQLIKGIELTLPKGCVHLNSEVIQITCRGKSSLVRCKSGQMFKADHVIETIPLGVLKACSDFLFDPPLPQFKTRAINSLSYGKVNKIFLKWNIPFWRQGNGDIKLGLNDEEMNITDKSEWYKKIFGFDEVLNNKHVLVAWISGNEAEYMETLGDIEIIDVCTAVLRKFLGDPTIPKPVSVLRSSWCTDPYFRGSYSNVNFKTTKNTFVELSAPLYITNGKPMLLFAGEATAEYGYSTMHGARRSGIREAQRLIDCYSNIFSSKILENMSSRPKL